MSCSPRLQTCIDGCSEQLRIRCLSWCDKENFTSVVHFRDLQVEEICGEDIDLLRNEATTLMNKVEKHACMARSHRAAGFMRDKEKQK